MLTTTLHDSKTYKLSTWTLVVFLILSLTSWSQFNPEPIPQDKDEFDVYAQEFEDRCFEHGISFAPKEELLVFIDQLIAQSKKLKLKHHHISLLSVKGGIEQSSGRLGNAREIYDEIIELSDKPNLLTAQIMIQIGVINDQLELTEEARTYYKRAIQMFDEIGGMEKGPELRVEAYNNLGASYSLDEQHEEAIKNFKIALSYATSDQQLHLAYLNSGLGSSYKSLTEYDKAFSYLVKALKNARSVNSPVMQGTQTYILIELIETIDLIDELSPEQQIIINEIGGKEALLGETYTFLAHGGESELTSTSLTAADIYARYGDYQKAYDVTLAHYDIFKNRLSDEQQELFAEMETKFQTKEKLAEEKRKREKSEMESETKLLKNTAYFLVLLSISLVALIFVIRGNLIRRRKAILTDQKNEYLKKMLAIETENSRLIQGDLENKRRDLTNFSLRAKRERIWIEELKTLSKEVRQGQVNDLESEILKISQDMNANLLHDEQFQLLNSQTDKLGAAFNQKLESNYPNLTNAESELCKLIRLGMSNSDIARIRNISKESARKARYRLRQKLSLLEDQNMEDFLVSL